jgi:hypothetical protein
MEIKYLGTEKSAAKTWDVDWIESRTENHVSSWDFGFDFVSGWNKNENYRFQLD